MAPSNEGRNSTLKISRKKVADDRDVARILRPDLNRLAASSMPSTATTFVDEVLPLTTAMLEALIPRRSASRATTASLARSYSGGAFTFTFSESPSQPTISSRDDPGTTLRLKRPMR